MGGKGNCSGLTIFEFIDQDKVTFFSERTYPAKFSPTSLAKWIMRASLRFRVRGRPEKYLLLSVWRRKLNRPGFKFLLFNKNQYKHAIFRSVILVSLFKLRVYSTFSFFIVKSILKTRRMSHLFSSALFTVPLTKKLKSFLCLYR